MLDRNATLASIVLDHSECAQVFQRHRIDFCCNGRVTLEVAAKANNIDLDSLLGELSRAISIRTTNPEPRDLRSLPTPSLIAYIIATHHDYLRQTLPFVQKLAEKVARVHGEREANLRYLRADVAEFARLLTTHLDEEEKDVFPVLMMRNVDPEVSMSLIGEAQREHLVVAALLRRIREHANDYELPDGACNSHRTLFSELEQLESDVFAHIHLENHVLMPRFSPS